jgi:hypothetical protein
MTRKELDTITDITHRAADMNIIHRDRLSFFMDIEAAHADIPIDLDALLSADEFNFYHDIIGIQSHINRETLKLDDCFVPRFAR